MNLFGKEKELIQKIVNGILLIWFLTALSLTTYKIITIFIQNPEVTSYAAYKNNYCDYYIKEDSDITEEERDISCKEKFEIYKEADKYDTKMFIFGSLINVIIVGSTMFILNRKK